MLGGTDAVDRERHRKKWSDLEHAFSDLGVLVGQRHAASAFVIATGIASKAT
jgi:hypothetical protein